MRSVSKAVEAAITGLYTTFSRYAMSDPFDFCDHCVTAEELDEIRRTALHDLTFDQLWRIESNIVWTIGGVADFKFFLPRLIEGSRYGADYDIESVFGRLHNTSFEAWPSDERLAVQNYIRCQFEEIVTSPVEPSTGLTKMDTLLCCAGYAEMLPELLVRLTSDARETARRQLLDWVLGAFGLLDDPYAFMEPRLPVQPINPYYDVPNSNVLLNWLRTTEAQSATLEVCATTVDLPPERRRRLERILNTLNGT